MGYNTSYWGNIELFDKKAIKIIKKLFEEKEEPFDDTEIDFVDDDIPYIEVNCSWKDDDFEMNQLCFFVAMLDKKARGIIECSGDERDDIARIVVCNGVVLLERGIIVYEKGEKFEDIKIKKKIYEITKDKQLLKEIMLEELK